MKSFIVLITLITYSLILNAQDDFKIVNSKIEMAGTSTLHDWTADVTKVYGSGKLSMTAGELTGIDALAITMDAKSIKSEKGSTMDNNIYKTLKASKYPSINFTLTKVNSLTKKGSSYEIKADGKLTIAGTTKTISLLVTGQETGGNIILKGSKTLKMTDYNLEPPVMFLGTLKTADDVTVKFETTLSKSNQIR